MAQMYKCDKCNKQIDKELFYIVLGYIRTLDEISELLEVKRMPVNEDTIERMRLASQVTNVLEVCKVCYDEYKKVNFK